MHILRQEGWKLSLLMHQRAVRNRKKPGNTIRYLTQTERRTKVRLGQAEAAANTVDEQAAAALKATLTLVLASCCVLWIDNWYRAQYTTQPDESDRSQIRTAMAVFDLKQRPTYWAGYPAIEDLAPRITTVARALQQREKRITQTLRDMGHADGCVPDTRSVRAPFGCEEGYYSGAASGVAPVSPVEGKGNLPCGPVKLVAVCEGHSKIDKQGCRNC